MKLKALLLTVLLAVFSKSGVFAQGYPVIDVMGIVTAIENGYTMYEQCIAMVNQVQNTYKQIEQQVKNFALPDISKLDASDPLGSFRTIMTYGNRQMNYVNNIKNLLNAENLKIGDASFSYADFFQAKPWEEDGAAGQVGSMLGSAIEFTIFDPFKERSPAEKAALASRYGMSPANYMRYNMMGDAIKKKTGQIVATLDSIETEAERDAKMLEEIMQKGSASESVAEQALTANTLTMQQIHYAQTQNKILTEFAAAWMMAKEQEEIKNDEAQKRRNMNELDFAKGFTNMIEKIPSNDKYKSLRGD